MWRAFAASLAVHAVVALCIPAFAWTASAAPEVETISFAHVTRVIVEPRRRAEPRPRAQAPKRSPDVRVTAVSNSELAHASHRRNASPPPAIAHADAAAPAIAQTVREGAPTGAPDAVAATTPTPEPARQVASTMRHTEDGTLPFTAEQPDPVLDPNVRKQLQELGIHVTLIVTVDEDGRTKNVAYDPPVDPATQTKIAALLADASWDPAVCGGGISCEGRATIKL